jgi:6-pyruvoyltetrahydropterin/6-carboxytetrahydropterin synthase
MYYISKEMEIASAHQLTLDYESKCKNLHGHNWLVTVFCKSKILNQNGMVVDFKHIKNMISDKLDHAYLNDVVDFNPTAENMARWICENVPNCYKVSVQESRGNIAIYEKD